MPESWRANCTCPFGKLLLLIYNTRDSGLREVDSDEQEAILHLSLMAETYTDAILLVEATTFPSTATSLGFLVTGTVRARSTAGARR